MGSTTVRLGPLGVTAPPCPPDLVPEPEVSSGAVNYRQTCGELSAFPSAPSDFACTVCPVAGTARLDNVSAHS